MYNPDFGSFSAKGNEARSSRLTLEEKKSIASNAAKIRWNRHREALKLHREALEISSSHTCEYNCKCSKCGRFKYKHVAGGAICDSFLCEKKNVV